MIARRGLMIGAALSLAATPSMAQPQPADPANLLAYLMELEKGSWQYVKERNIAGMQNYLADDALLIFGDGSRYNVAIQYKTQTVQDGTGRVVELAHDFVTDRPFILAYGDILVNPTNYRRVVNLPDDADAILTVTRGEDVSKGGAVFLNDEMELLDLREKPKPGEPTSPWYNAGLYAFRPSIFDFTAKLKPSPRGEFELTDAIRDLAQSGNKVKALELTGEWADVRDPETLARLNQ